MMIQIIITLLAFNTELSRAGISTVLYNMSVTADPKYAVANSTIFYKVKSDKSSYEINFDQYILQELQSATFYINLVRFPKIGARTAGEVIIDVSTNFCDATAKKRRKGDVFVHMVYQLWKKYGNFTFGCPVQKGLYVFRGLTMNELKIPFVQYMVKETDYMLTYKFYTKERKKLVLFETIVYFGGFRRTADST
uniref:CSON013939 protein n=1 Tax=Culicoides sonorensis TaxID=179676 RepID=A0A336KPS2_CULSO